MDNTKDFKDNYKYNVKKVLQIIEKEKAEKKKTTANMENNKFNKK